MKNSCLIITCLLYANSSISETVYDVEAVRPFQGEPPIEEKQELVDHAAQTSEEKSAEPFSQALTDEETMTAENASEQSSDKGPGFAGEPIIVNEQTLENTQKVVIATGIYQCRDGQTYVFVDEQNKAKYAECSMVRAQQVTSVVTKPPKVNEYIDYCTGMIQFRGNTYVFDDQEPCPIPADVFQLLTPIEARPAYYLNQTSQP